jgi:hypothetical protein
VGGSLISASGAQSAADTQSQAAQNASQAQLQAAEQSIAAQQQSGEAAQANQQPWINAGSSALTQLGNLLGVPISASGQYAAPSTSQGGGASGGSGAGNWATVTNGVIGPNQQLYASNPIYKAAWDKVAQENSKNTWGGGNPWNVEDPNNPSGNAADMASLNAQIAGNIRGMGGDPNQIMSGLNSSGQFQPGMTYGGPTGGFAGSTGQITDPSSFGAQAKQRLSDLMGFNGADPTAALRATPGYQFTLNQGLQGIENSAAARGMQLSGATLKDLNNYAQGMADTTYQQQLGDAQSVYNTDVGNLMQLAGLGGSSAGTASGNAISTGQGIGSTLTSTGNQIGSNIIGAGNATAAGQVGASNAIGSGIGSLGQMYTLNQLFGSNAGFGTPSTASGTNSYGFVMPS